MSVPWEQAFQVGGVGFVMVFAILIILAGVIQLTGFIIKKMNPVKGEKDDERKGE